MFTTFSTVGYGDIAPVNAAEMIFVSCTASVGSPTDSTRRLHNFWCVDICVLCVANFVQSAVAVVPRDGETEAHGTGTDHCGCSADASGTRVAGDKPDQSGAGKKREAVL